MANTGAAAKADFIQRISRAVLCAVLLAFLIVAAWQGIARADTATSSVTGNDFTSIVIRQGSADGTIVATLVGEGATPPAAAVLMPDTEYYLCATVKKTSEGTNADYVKLVVGDGAEESLIANGINITNPPGGSTRTVGGIDSNSLDYLLASSDIADGTYGADYNNGSPKMGVSTYKMADGIWEWRLKSNIAKDDTYSFNIGFKVDGAFFAGANKDIANALNLSIGSLLGAQDTTDPAIASTSDTLSLGVAFSSSVKAKNPFISLASTGTGIPSGTSSMGYNSCGFYPVTSSTMDPQSLLYQTIEFDIVHPAGTAVSYIGFSNDGLDKSSYSTARGAFSRTDTGTDANGNIITHVTLSAGFVPSTAIGFYYKMAFDNTIRIGDKPTVTFQNYKATGFDGSVINSSLKSTCVFTIVDPTLDVAALADTAYTVAHYKVSANGEFNTRAYTENLTGATGATVYATPQTFDGYTYQPSFDQNGMKTVASGTITGNGGLFLTLYYTPNTDTKYTVNYIRLKNDGTTQVATEAGGTRTGTTDARVGVDAIAAGKAYPGFTYAPGKTTYADAGHATAQADVLPIAADGSLVVNLYYVENDNVGIYYSSTNSNCSVIPSFEWVAPVTGSPYGSTATAQNGYHFVNWMDASGNVLSTEEKLVPAKVGDLYTATTYWANFAPNNYDITYDLAGGTATGSNPASYTVESESFLLSNPTRAGYRFKGWTGSGIQGYSQSVWIYKGISKGNLAYTAIWEAITYDITYKSGDHGTMTNASGSPIADNTVDGVFDQPTPLPTATLTARAGYTFAGWKADDKAGTVYTDAQLAALKVTGGATYTAQWTANTDTAYTVNRIRVKSNGFSDPIAETIAKTGVTGSAVDVAALAAEKSYAGYAFDSAKTLFTDAAHQQGWYDPLPIAGDGGLAVNLYYVEGANVRLGFAPDDASRGSVDWPQMLLRPATGEAFAVTAKANPGYAFSKWIYANKTHATAIDVPGATTATISAGQIDSVAKDTGAYEATSFEAVFAENSDYTVAYDLNYAEPIAPVSKTGVKWTEAGLLPDMPIRSGYVFGGWYATTDCTGDAITATTTFAVASRGVEPAGKTVKLYAKWIGQKAMIDFDPQGGSDVVGIEGRTGDVIEAAFPADAPTLAGHTFAGWYTAASDGDKVASYPAAFPAGITTYYARWTRNNYTVSFDSNGGSAVSSQSVAYESTGTEPTVPERTGYTFGAWHLGTATGPAYNFATPVTGPIVLVASWELTSYDITYDLDKGTLASGGTNPTSYTVDDAFTLANPTRENYLFSGWIGTELSAATMKVAVGKGSIGIRSYTATWTAIDAQKTPLVYDGNGADANVPTDAVIYRSGDTVKVSNVVPERTGFNFVGWLARGYFAMAPQSTGAASARGADSLTTQASGKLFAPGNSFTMPADAPVVLVAQWSVDSYLVSFDTGEGGSYIAPQTIKNGTFATQPVDPARAGYEFTGWFTDATCSRAFDFGTTPITSATTVVAGWKLITNSIVSDAGTLNAIPNTGDSSILASMLVAILAIGAAGLAWVCRCRMKDCDKDRNSRKCR